jgi:hypothetical protein
LRHHIHRYFDKHAYRHGHRKHHNHRYYAQNHNYYQRKVQKEVEAINKDSAIDKIESVFNFAKKWDAEPSCIKLKVLRFKITC